MKKIIVMASALALGACSAADTGADEVVEEEVVVAEVSPVAGTYAGSGEDGESWTSTLAPDGTYEDTINGEVTETGTWTETAGLTCFVVDVAEGEVAEEAECFTVGEVAEDGTVVVTNAAGEQSTLTKVVD